MQRIAVLPFENLTGDASLDWIRAAGPAILTEEVAGATRLLPLRVPSRSEAGFAGATRVLHCGFSKTGAGGALRFDYEIEDWSTHKTVASGTANGAVLFAVNTLARALDSGAKPFSSTHPDAIAAWGRGEFERAVTFDPDFGAAWSSWIEQLARSSKTDEALVTADKALMRSSLRSPLNRAQIQLQAANLRKDEPARIAALTALAGLTPTDVAASLALAEVEQRQRNYTESAALYRRVLTIDPANAAALNGLGYAEGEAGRVDAAVEALRRYGQLPGQGTNALDSIGEVYFMNGRFAEAEKYFSQVTAHDPSFAEGAALMKAAYAHWLAGDRSGADMIARRYLDVRAAQKDPDVTWREAVWLFATGREKEAVAKLGSASAEQKPRVDRQLSVWRGEVKPPTDVTQLKALYTGTNPAADGLVRMIYANALLAAGNTAEVRALLQRWPLPESAGDPLLQSLVFPEFLDLRRKLGIQ